MAFNNARNKFYAFLLNHFNDIQIINVKKNKLNSFLPRNLYIGNRKRRVCKKRNFERTHIPYHF